MRTNTEGSIRESSVLQIRAVMDKCGGRSKRGHKNLARFSRLQPRLSEPRKTERFLCLALHSSTAKQRLVFPGFRGELQYSGLESMRA